MHAWSPVCLDTINNECFTDAAWIDGSGEWHGFRDSEGTGCRHGKHGIDEIPEDTTAATERS